jgi:hypothetical protein
MIATGILWFQFEDKTNGHFKWALVMEAILPNVDDRSSVVEFKSTGDISSSGHFASEGCTAAGDGPASAPAPAPTPTPAPTPA